MQAIQLRLGEATSETAKVKAMRQVAAHTYSGWNDTALDAVRIAAQNNRQFTVDKVWEYMPTPNPLHDPQLEARAMGPVMVRAKNLGWIQATMMFYPTVRPTSHGRPCRRWGSLIYNQIVEIPKREPKRPAGSLPR